jgi:hypothetical protein
MISVDVKLGGQPSRGPAGIDGEADVFEGRNRAVGRGEGPYFERLRSILHRDQESWEMLRGNKHQIR